MVKDYTTNKNHILISAYCHDDTPAELSKCISRIDVLRLQFDDWDDEQRIKIKARYQNSQKMKDMIFFSEEHAKQLVDFVRKYLNDIELIICQCDAGISRSAGMAAALSKCIENDDKIFFKNYLPNSLVYSTILKIWQLGEI